MKKLLSFLLVGVALLGVSTLASAHSISYNPEDTMSQMTVPVYNNSGSPLSAGAIVVWDIGSSSSDNDAWVTTTTTADTAIVAGVIWPSAIGTAQSGSMAVWGLAQCDVAGAITAGGPVCSSGTAGLGGNCSNEARMIAIMATTTVASGDQANCFVLTR